MPIHHKSLEKRRIKRKKKPATESRGLIRTMTKSSLVCSDSQTDIQTDKRPETPKYLKDNYDYDASSSSSTEETAEDDGKLNMLGAIFSGNTLVIKTQNTWISWGHMRPLKSTQNLEFSKFLHFYVVIKPSKIFHYFLKS